MASEHINVGISPEADIELAQALVELRRAGHRISKRQLASLAVQRFVLELREELERGREGTALHSLLGQEIADGQQQAMAA
jgi:hypothetical protein